MSCYSIYLDETGDFQGNTYENDALYGIFGFVWSGDTHVLRDTLKNFCTNLSDWLRQEQKDAGLPFPHCLHTTENKSLERALKRHEPETDLLHTRLWNTPVTITGIYAFKAEVDHSEFDLDSLYRKMIHTLIRQITKKIRSTDPEAKITFHIPTRDTVFELSEKKQNAFQQRNINVRMRPDKETGLLNQSVSLNTSEAFLGISDELNISCPVRRINNNTSDPDREDELFHKDNNPESTLWGYYTADILNCWMRSIAKQPGKDPKEIETEISALLKTYLLLPFSKDIEFAQHATDRAKEDPCGYLKALAALQAIQNPSPRTEYATHMMEDSNPFSDPFILQAAGKQIDEQFIHKSKYTQAKKLLEQLKRLSEQTENKGSWAYSDIISKLMTCYHHEGGNAKAQELFNVVSKELGNDRMRSMDICNKYQEFFVNTLAFEQGIRFVEAVLDSYKPTVSTINLGGVSISGGNASDEARITQARTMSSLGSLYAYIGQKEKAENLFREAIQLFLENGRTVNAQITRAHLAQLLLDTENIHSEALLLALNLYFSKDETNIPDPDKSATWDKWLADSFTQCTNEKEGFNPEDASFYFWIWLKAIIKLPDNVLQNDGEFLRILSKHPQILDIMRIRKHPAALIRKYDAILRQRLGNQRYIKKDLEVIDEIIQLNEQHGTIPLLCRVAIYDISQSQMSADEIKSLESAAYEDIKKLYADLHQGQNDQMVESLIDRLYQKQSLSMSELKDSLLYEFR